MDMFEPIWERVSRSNKLSDELRRNGQTYWQDECRSRDIARLWLSLCARFGMIKYHGELLTEYPGAQSILRAIHVGASEMGFTIHRINAGIDGGGIRL
jgi:hypothetical protein